MGKTIREDMTVEELVVAGFIGEESVVQNEFEEDSDEHGNFALEKLSRKQSYHVAAKGEDVDLGQLIEGSFDGNIDISIAFDGSSGEGMDSIGSYDVVDPNPVMAFAPPAKKLSAQENAHKVEAELLKAVQAGKSLHMKRAASQVSFGAQYAKAVDYNPSLKWYMRFARMLDDGRFGIQNNALFVDLKEAELEKAVKSMKADYAFDNHESPINVLIGTLVKDYYQKEKNAAAYLRKSQEKVSGREKATDISPYETGGMFVAELEDDQDEITMPGNDEEPRLDPNEEGGVPQDKKVKEKIDPGFNIKLEHLSLMAIVEFFFEQDFTEEEAMKTMKDQNFKNDMIGKVIGALELKNMEKVLEEGVFEKKDGQEDIVVPKDAQEPGGPGGP